MIILGCLILLLLLLLEDYLLWRLYLLTVTPPHNKSVYSNTNHNQENLNYNFFVGFRHAPRLFKIGNYPLTFRKGLE